MAGVVEDKQVRKSSWPYGSSYMILCTLTSLKIVFYMYSNASSVVLEKEKLQSIDLNGVLAAKLCVGLQPASV